MTDRNPQPVEPTEFHCSYCGFCYQAHEQATPLLLRMHIEECPQHPVSALKAELSTLRTDAASCIQEKDKEIAALWRQIGEARQHLRLVLAARNAEAKATLAVNVALDNYTDPNPDVRAQERAMIEASRVERKAREYLAAKETDR